MKKLFLTLGAALTFTAHAQTDGYTMLCDSNGVALPGFYLPASNLLGTVIAQLPTNTIFRADLTSATNTATTNANYNLLNASNLLAASLAFSTNWLNTNLTTRLNTASNLLATNDLAQLNSASDFLSTNIAQFRAATNTLRAEQTNATIVTSNGLNVAFTYNIALASNANATAITVVSNSVMISSNALRVYITGVSNLVAVAGAKQSVHGYVTRHDIPVSASGSIRRDAGCELQCVTRAARFHHGRCAVRRDDLLGGFQNEQRFHALRRVRHQRVQPQL
jgi:hypothetical protein